MLELTILNHNWGSFRLAPHKSYIRENRCTYVCVYDVCNDTLSTCSSRVLSYFNWSPLKAVPPECPQQNKWSPQTVYGNTSGPPRLFVVAVSGPPLLHVVPHLYVPLHHRLHFFYFSFRTWAILTLFFCLASFPHLGLTNAVQCGAAYP